MTRLVLLEYLFLQKSLLIWQSIIASVTGLSQVLLDLVTPAVLLASV